MALLVTLSLCKFFATIVSVRLTIRRNIVYEEITSFKGSLFDKIILLYSNCANLFHGF